MALLGLNLQPPSFERSRRRPPGSRWQRFLFGLLLFLFSFNAGGLSRAEDSKEYQLKAAFLYNFAQFVKWPSDSFASADAPFTIGILGDDPFGSALEATIQGEAIDNHKLRVVRGQNFADLKECQLIFICKSEQRKIDDILSGLGAHPVLTVSEVSGFARQGGIIAFYQDGKKVRFEINPAVAQKSGLKLSSQLLGLGRIVGADTVKEGS